MLIFMLRTGAFIGTQAIPDGPVGMCGWLG